MASIDIGYVGEVDASWRRGLVAPETAWRLSVAHEPTHPPACHEATCPRCHYAYNAHLTGCPGCAA